MGRGGKELEQNKKEVTELKEKNKKKIKRYNWVQEGGGGPIGNEPDRMEWKISIKTENTNTDIQTQEHKLKIEF